MLDKNIIYSLKLHKIIIISEIEQYHFIYFY